MPTSGQVKPRKGSAAWYRAEMDRYKKLCHKHSGLTTPLFASVILGISRQRVYQLMDAGRLTVHDIIGKKWLQVDEVEAFDALERTSAYRYAEIAA